MQRQMQFLDLSREQSQALKKFNIKGDDPSVIICALAKELDKMRFVMRVGFIYHIANMTAVLYLLLS